MRLKVKAHLNLKSLNNIFNTSIARLSHEFNISLDKQNLYYDIN